MLTATGHVVAMHAPTPVEGYAGGGAGLVPLGAPSMFGEAVTHSALPGAAPAPAGTGTPRVGFEPDVPRGGTSAYNAGGDYPTGDRWTFMRECYGAYLACPWLSAPIDTTARTVTAGGVIVEPDDTTAGADVKIEDAPRQAQKLQALIKWVNAQEDMVQLMRGVSADLDIYGDSFTEVVWLLGEPVALYSLDAAGMSIHADEHGNVLGYWQRTDGHPDPVWFDPHEVIHVSEDSPKGALYGVGFVQKAFWPATTWLFTAALLKERMRKGDPPDLHVDAPLEQQDNEFRRWAQQYRTKNVGAGNLGNPVMTKGGFTITELRQSSRSDLIAIKTDARDEMISLSGVTPHQVGVIESGNLGGGTGSSQWKSYQLNRVAPRAALILEKFNFALCQAFGLTGWRLAFGVVDYRDDQVLEEIRIGRLRNMIWSLNEARADMGLPPIEGDSGDLHMMIEKSWAMTLDQMEDFARSWVVKNGGVNYPAVTDDGFPPPNPHAVPPAPIAPRAGPADPSEPDQDPDEVDDDTPPGQDAPPGRRRRAANDPTTESWMGRVTAHYTRQLQEAGR